MKTYTIEEQDALGNRIADIFRLKKDAQGRYITDWGSKTPIGLYHTVLRISENIVDGVNF